jgi:hypothetical protein
MRPSSPLKDGASGRRESAAHRHLLRHRHEPRPPDRRPPRAGRRCPGHRPLRRCARPGGAVPAFPRLRQRLLRHGFGIGTDFDLFGSNGLLLERELHAPAPPAALRPAHVRGLVALARRLAASVQPLRHARGLLRAAAR